jgi:hypothetical protein
MPDDQNVQIEAERAAAEAARIGGDPGAVLTGADGEELDEAQRPLTEAGQGESEGFELAEAELVDAASHADQHAAGHVIEDDAAQIENPDVKRRRPGAPTAGGDTHG